MKNKTKYLMAGIFGILAVVWIALVRCADVAAIGPTGTSVGLSRLNQAVHDLTGVNMLWYTITDWLGIVAILAVAAMALLGFIQLVKRKSLLKVDREILALGGLYVVIFVLYVFFEKVIVNYRPIIMPGCTAPEASFPSSHTMLTCVVLGGIRMVLDKYVKHKGLCTALKALCWLIILVTVVGRLISGVHWFTDIVGGLLISTALLALFAAVKTKEEAS